MHADAAMIHLAAARKRSGNITSYTVTRGTDSFEIDTTFALSLPLNTCSQKKPLYRENISNISIENFLRKSSILELFIKDLQCCKILIGIEGAEIFGPRVTVWNCDAGIGKLCSGKLEAHQLESGVVSFLKTVKKFRKRVGSWNLLRL